MSGFLNTLGQLKRIVQVSGLISASIWSVWACAETGIIEIYSEPSGAEVFLDGRSVGFTPYTNPEIPIGDHEVKVVAEGDYAAQFWRGVIDEITPRVNHFVFQQPSTSAWPGESDTSLAAGFVGNVQFASIPTGARLVINSVAKGVTPHGYQGIGEGRYQVTFELADGRVLSGDFDIIRDETIKIIADFNQGQVHNRWRESFLISQEPMLINQKLRQELAQVRSQLALKERLLELSQQREKYLQEQLSQRSAAGQKAASPGLDVDTAADFKHITRSGSVKSLGQPLSELASPVESEVESLAKDQIVKPLSPESRLMPKLAESAWPSVAAQQSALWLLGLNISTDASSHVERFQWQDIDSRVNFVDTAGQAHALVVSVQMRGEGDRVLTGKSLFRRIRQYQYDFDFSVQYNIYVDGKLISAARRTLNSDNALVDRNGVLTSAWFSNPEEVAAIAVASRLITLRYGCSNPDWQNLGKSNVAATTVLTNIDIAENSLQQINQYFCLAVDLGAPV